MAEWWTVRVTDRRGVAVHGGGELPQIKSGSLEWSIFKPVGGSGSLEFDEDAELDIDWYSSWLQVRHHSDESGTEQIRPFGLWMPVLRQWEHRWPRRSATVELFDACELLNWPCGQWYSAGTTRTVVEMVREILDRFDAMHSIVDSSAVLTTPLAFEPEATWLKIVNDLLAAIGYGAVRAGLDGVLTAGPYLAPERRLDRAAYGADQLPMKPTFSDEAPIWDAPNVVTVYSPATDTTPALLGTARNDDPASPLSTVHRGERRLVEAHELASQTVADQTAARRLREASQITRRVTWRHPLDETWLDDMVTLEPLDGERVAIVQRSINLTIGAVVETTGRRIYTGGEAPTWA